MIKHSLRYIILILSLLYNNEIRAHSFKDETLNYKVMFKWGLVQKQAGRATLQLTEDGNLLVAKLFARSENWADKFYSLRDTLISHMEPHDMLPIKYQRIAHENGSFAHDIITIDKNHNPQQQSVKGISKRIRRKKNDSQITESTITMEAQGAAVDMLSAFYYIRTLDFSVLKPGYSTTVNIFSGKRKELLTIKYEGTENLNLDGVNYSTYKITFSFSTESSTKSSDGIETWIWANNQKIPLKMEGKLKVGKIRCLYVRD